MIALPKPKQRLIAGPDSRLPRCPADLDAIARKEWRRLAKPRYDCGILTVADRAAFWHAKFSLARPKKMAVNAQDYGDG